ncbi:hypothetical protein [Rhodococcus sp. 24CO]|uniref:hypothetical protein n=1 Tax=Rhodococcus sp. 24CO TaxID=3117460 RepID=UPI003D351238
MRRAISVVLVAVLAIAACALLWIRRDTAALESVRADAMAQAPALVEDLLTYTSEMVDRDLAAGAGGATGTFRDEFVEFSATTVAPQSKVQGISTSARVVDVGLLDTTRDRVELLMFVDQITTSFAQPAPASSSSRVQVAVERVGDRWLVSELTPI